MRIGYIVTMRKGLPAFVFREIKGLKELGHEVFLYVMQGGAGPYMPEKNWLLRKRAISKVILGLFSEGLCSIGMFAKLFVTSVRSGTMVDLLIAAAFAPQIRADKLDAILCFEGLHGLRIGYYCHRLTGVPISVIVHAEMLRIKKHRAFTHMALMAGRRIISPTQLNCRRIVEEFNVPADKVVLNRMSTDIVTFKHDDRFKILIVGFFADRKGHETLLRAIEYLNRQDIVVWVVGGDVWGGEKFDVEGFIREHGLENRVILFGKAPDSFLHVLLDACDAFCLPCRTSPSGIVEGLPVAIMEAMAYEKPVISTRHTGIPELVPEILVEENDYIGVANAILKLKDDPELRKKMGVRNREIIEQKYGPQNIENMANILAGD